MINKIWKKVTSSLLTIMMVLSMVAVVPVQAAAEPLQFNADNYYAVVFNGKAINIKAVGWQTRTTVDGDYVANGSKVTSQSLLKFTPLADQSGLSTDEVKVQIDYVGIKGETYPIRSEGGNTFVFADMDKRTDACTYIIKKINDNVGIIQDTTKNYYFSILDSGEIERVENQNDATEFTFIENPNIIDNTVYIENVATGKLVSFQNQSDEDYAPIKVVGDKENITDFEKFVPTFQTNDVGIKDVVSFQSVGKTGYQICSDKWVDGAVPAIGSFKKNGGGWEAIAIAPIGNGQFVFKDAALGKLVTINENNELEGGYEGEITDREKFIIHNSIDFDENNSLEANLSSRTETSIELSWVNPLSLYTDIQLYQKASNEEIYTKIADLTDENSYKVENLISGMQYTFKLRYISGNGNLQDSDNPIIESNEIEVKTRAGAKPETPTDVRLVEKGNNKLQISWSAAENATHYKLQRADSAYAIYEDVKIVKGDTLSIEIEFENEDKYKNYYRVVALNNGNFGDEDFSEAEESEKSEFVSIEKNMFGDHTLIFAETDDTAKIDEILQALYDQQSDASNDAQFKAGQYQVYFKPGDYTNTSCIYLGFYTSINGLGETPYDVKLNNIAIPAYLSDNNATCNFWRSTENVSIINTGNPQGKAQYNSWRSEEFNWAVAQAAPLRRVYSQRNVSYDWNYGWASGGYVADCLFEGDAGTWSGQQFYTRNSVVKGNAFGTTLNNFYQGVKADSLPNENTGEELLNGNGYSNWNIASSDGGQQVFTNVETTPELSEKPFLYIDDNGEYQVFVPAVRKNTSGVSWSEDDMGEGTSIPLSEFYIAKPEDSAATINQQIAAGKNIYFTPGTYHAEEPILVNEDDTILLGTGMASIIPDNEKAAMIIADDVEGVKVAGLIFDAGTHSEYLLKVGENEASKGNSENPIVLQDLFFRVGGTTDVLTKADNALEINSNNVLCDHFWIWRADHGAGVEWYGNESQHGLVVNGDDVKCYALFNEHFQEYDTLWNGENGATYFYQNEKCYDPISQDAWMTHNGTVNGYAAYKVANDVENHYAVGLGIYNVFIYTGESYDSSEVQIQMDNAIEVPNKEGVIVENACIQTFAKDDGALQKFNYIVNGVGQGVSSGVDQETGEKGEGWSRKFLISYNNGTAVIGQTNSDGKVDPGNVTKTIENVQQLGEEIDSGKLQSLKDLMETNKNLVESDYTISSWVAYTTALAEVTRAVSEDYLKYDATQLDFDKISNEYSIAMNGLVNISALKAEYDEDEKLDKSLYTADTWNTFSQALKDARNVLENKDATQLEVASALSLLTNAKAGLVKVSETNTNTNTNTNSSKENNTNSNSKTHSTKKGVTTGDDSPIALFATLGLMSAGIFTVIKRKRED